MLARLRPRLSCFVGGTMLQTHALKFTVAAFLILTACQNQNFDLPPSTLEYGQVVTYNRKVDILIMVDNSSSMLQYQNKFSTQVPEMIARLNAIGMDYQIGVTTSDMRASGTGGQLFGNPKFITKNTPNGVAILQNMIRVGESGSDLERGISSVYQLLQPGYLAGEGAGFIRQDALLGLVFLTNEDDYSQNAVADYKAYFDSIKPLYKGNQRGWIANFIGVVSIDGECQTTPDFKEAGLRYMSLVTSSGGVKESICRSSLSNAIKSIGARIEQVLTEFYLQRKPVLDTITVTVGGKAILEDPVNGWTYHEDGNFIRMHGTSIPGENQSVVIDFQPLEAT